MQHKSGTALRQNFQASVEVRLKRLISTAVEMRLKKSLVNRTCG